MGPRSRILDEPVVAEDPQNEADDGGNRQAEQRVHARGLGRQKPGVHADHQEFAVGEIDDVHDPEDDGQAQGHQGQHHADQQTGYEGCEEDIHDERKPPARIKTARPAAAADRLHPRVGCPGAMLQLSRARP